MPHFVLTAVAAAGAAEWGRARHESGGIKPFLKSLVGKTVNQVHIIFLRGISMTATLSQGTSLYQI